MHVKQQIYDGQAKEKVQKNSNLKRIVCFKKQ